MRQSTPLLPSVDEIMYEMTARENSSQVAPAPSDRKKPLVIEPVARRHKTKVAAYCRVSKDDDDQRSSILAQRKHFLSLLADQRIGEADELLALARSLNASPVLFDGEAFKQFMESVTIRGREVFVFRFRCGYTCELRKEVASCESRK